jgi:hypothetical protein
MAYVLPQLKKNIALTCGDNVNVYVDRVERA